MTRTTQNIFLSGMLFLLCAGCVMQVLAAYAGDKTWLLYAAGMWLKARVLDVDIVEVNPPLIIWIYALPSWIGAHAGLKDYHALGLMGVAGCLASVAVSTRIVSRHPEFGKARMQGGFALFLAALFLFFTMPAYFFDREHILLVLAFPYMLRFMPSLALQRFSWPLRITIGCMAALGFCIKPYTLFIFAALQLLYMLRERSPAILISCENIVIYLFFILYVLCIWHYTPEYIHSVFPMAMATYSAFSRRSLGFLYAIYAFVTAGISFADFRLRFKTPYRRDILYFTGVSMGFLLYALANNGWGYTYNPLITMLLFLTGALFLEYDWLRRAGESRGLPVRQFVFGRRACLLNLAGNAAYILYCMGVFFITPACAWSSDCVKNQPYVHYIKENNIASFGALSEDFHKWPSLARLSGASFDTRYNSLWMLPALVSEGKGASARHRWIIDAVASGLADDLNMKRPQVIFVDNGRRFFGYDFDIDLPGFFSQVPVFKEAWSHYRYASFIDGCKFPSVTGCRYDIYRRMD